MNRPRLKVLENIVVVRSDLLNAFRKYSRLWMESALSNAVLGPRTEDNKKFIECARF